MSGPGVVAPLKGVGGLITRRLRIPSFQRGIVWDATKIDDLLDSPSLTLGTIIVGQVATQTPILVDGLQRFAVGTALLKALYPEVLAPRPNQPGSAPHFRKLQAHAAGLQPVFDHNSRALRRHPRLVIRESYSELEDEVLRLVADQLARDPARFANRVIGLFLSKQIALDEYSNFASMQDLSHTFIAMNTGGVSLDSVDLLRSFLVDHAMDRRWPAAQIEEMENQFSRLFEVSSGRGHVQALAKALHEALTEDRSRAFIIPQWATFEKRHADELLEFVEECVASGTDNATPPSYPYFRELYDCGPQAFTVAVLHFWIRHKAGDRTPDFAGGPRRVPKSSHLLLRAFYRRTIDGTIFRVENTIDALKVKGPRLKIADVATSVNPPNIGNLSSPPNSDWLNSRLRGADSKRSRRIFNACLLPDRSKEGGPFLPARYGNAKHDWSIDHLIPDSHAPRAAAGGIEAQRLTNFAPFPSKLNKAQRAMPCSVKMAAGGLYPGQRTKHPYIQWLVDVQYAALNPPTLIDEPAHLVQGDSDRVGDDRVAELARLLSIRL